MKLRIHHRFAAAAFIACVLMPGYAWADVPAGPELGAGLGIAAVVGCCSLGLLLAIAALVIWLVVRSKRKAAPPAEPGQPAAYEPPAGPPSA